MTRMLNVISLICGKTKFIPVEVPYPVLTLIKLFMPECTRVVHSGTFGRWRFRSFSTYNATIDRPEDEPVVWTGCVGWVQDLWRQGVVDEAWGFHPTPENTDIFLCGNPDMIDEMVDLLSEEGYQAHSPRKVGEIHLERY